MRLCTVKRVFVHSVCTVKRVADRTHCVRSSTSFNFSLLPLQLVTKLVMLLVPAVYIDMVVDLVLVYIDPPDEAGSTLSGK